MFLRLQTISVTRSTLVIISWAFFLQCFKVRIPLVGGVNRFSSLPTDIFETWVVGIGDWPFAGCAVDIESWMCLLVMIGDLALEEIWGLKWAL